MKKTKEPCILAVDDEERRRVFLSGYLWRKGFKVILASSQFEARNILSKGGIDAVISDNNMETHDAGIELCAWMRAGSEVLQKIPFILHTADDTARTKQMIESMGGTLCPKDDSLALYDAVEALLQK